MLTASGMIFLAVLAFGAVRGAIERSEEPSTAVPEVTAEAPRREVAAEDVAIPKAQERCGATMAEFQRLRSGMSYRDAVRVIGCEGTELSRVEIGGVTVMYMWEGSDTFFGNMNATFDNDRLVSKAQIGLE